MIDGKGDAESDPSTHLELPVDHICTTVLEAFWKTLQHSHVQNCQRHEQYVKLS